MNEATMNRNICSVETTCQTFETICKDMLLQQKRPYGGYTSTRGGREWADRVSDAMS